MKLEASPIGENAVGMNQIQTQLENLTLQLQDIKKGKEQHEDIWCIRCRTDGHTKDTCPYFQNYMLSGASNHLSCGNIPSCRIFQVYGHRHKECGYMQNMVMKPTNLYCSYNLLQERTYDLYYVKGEVQQPQPQL